MPTIASQRSSWRITAARRTSTSAVGASIAAGNFDECDAARNAAFARQIAGMRSGCASAANSEGGATHCSSAHFSSSLGMRRSSSGFVVRSTRARIVPCVQPRVDQLSRTNVLSIRDDGALRVGDDRVAALQRRERTDGVERSSSDGKALAESFHVLPHDGFDAGARRLRGACVRSRRAMLASADATPPPVA